MATMEKTTSPAKTTTQSNSLTASRHALNDNSISSVHSISDKSIILTSETSMEDNQSDIIDTTSSSTSDGNDCPLFMDGLQSNFAQNAALAALVSLLDEDENDGDADRYKDTDNKKSFAQVASSPAATHLNKSGGGKATKIATRRTKYSPYSKGKEEGEGRKEDETKQKKGATLGEAQLFLNMWKL